MGRNFVDSSSTMGRRSARGPEGRWRGTLVGRAAAERSTKPVAASSISSAGALVVAASSKALGSWIWRRAPPRLTSQGIGRETQSVPMGALLTVVTWGGAVAAMRVVPSK
jgi:hypothetical protein